MILYINMNMNELFPYSLCRGLTLKRSDFEVGRVVHKTLRGVIKTFKRIYSFVIIEVDIMTVLNSEQNEDKSIKSISVNGVEQIITQFADDTTLILDGSKESLVAPLNTLEIFGSMSGLKINTDKTKLIWIGKKTKDKINTTYNLAWGATDFNLLGINFSTDLQRITELNFSPTIKSIKQMLHVWHHRYITPIRKIAVIKTLAILKLNHLFISVPSPNKHILKEFETVFLNFIWDGKPDKVKRTSVTKNYQDGGLDMIDLNNFISALKTTWLRRMFMYSNAPWVNLALYNLGPIDKLFKLGPENINRIVNRTTNKFWVKFFTPGGEL